MVLTYSRALRRLTLVPCERVWAAALAGIVVEGSSVLAGRVVTGVTADLTHIRTRLLEASQIAAVGFLVVSRPTQPVGVSVWAGEDLTLIAAEDVSTLTLAGVRVQPPVVLT